MKSPNPALVVGVTAAAVFGGVGYGANRLSQIGAEHGGSREACVQHLGRIVSTGYIEEPCGSIRVEQGRDGSFRVIGPRNAAPAPTLVSEAGPAPRPEPLDSPQHHLDEAAAHSLQ